MKRIYLLRHAKSSWDEPLTGDFDRPLSPRGKRACRAIRTSVTRLGLEPQLVLCSSARRTEETWRRIAKAFPREPKLSLERQLYLASARKLLGRIHRLYDEVASVMLIGHNPGLQRLALLIATETPGDPATAELRTRIAGKFPTGALAVLTADVARWRDLEPGGARIETLVSPRGKEPD